MKLIERVTALAIFSSTLLFAQSASAFVQLRYNSDPLYFTQGFLGDHPDETVGSNEPPYPHIDLVFDDVIKGVGKHALPGHAFAKIFDWAGLDEDIPVEGNVKLNKKGVPVAWNLSFEVTKSTPGFSNGEFTDSNKYKLPTKDKWTFESSYGPGTCNCDKYRFDYDLYIERPYYSWAYANTLGFLFEGNTSPSNWVATNKVEVPEPNAYLLMLMGLIAVGVARVRNREGV